MTLPSPLPDHTTGAGAGPGQPIHTEELGQSYFPSPSLPDGLATDSSSLHPGKYLVGLTLDNVYRLLTKMIDSLQTVAVVQADRLNILTQWQNAYNAKKNSVHAFVLGNNDAFSLSTNDSTQNTRRQELNNLNANYTEQMRANSQVVSDDAKGLQTVINQSQDAVNKASNMATSLVQQFATILSTIYR